MSTQTFTITFNYNSFIKAQQAVWSYSTRKIYKPYITYTIMGVICFCTGLLFEKGEDFPIGKVLGGGFLTYMTLAWIGLFEKQIRFAKQSKVQASKYQLTGLNAKFTFTEEGITYQDDEKTFGFKWQLIKPYVIYHDTLMIIYREATGIMFNIGRQEVGDEVFLQICGILDEKLK